MNSFLDRTKQEQLVSTLVRTFDFHQKRITNAASSQNLNDYVIKAELEALKTEINSRITPKITQGTLSPDERPTDAVFGDMFVSKDFNHIYIFNGISWLWCDGGNDFVGWFRTAPGIGWHLCDGSTNIRRSKSDGTTELITVPTLNAKVVARWDATYSGPTPTAAVAPTGTFSGTPGTTTTEGASATTVDNTLAGSTVSVAAHPHTHGFTPAGTLSMNADGHDKLMDGLPYIRL